MTQEVPHSHEGHHHPHPIDANAPHAEFSPRSEPITIAPPSPEAMQAGAVAWLAEQFVGGLVATAEAQGADVAKYLAEKCAIMSMMLASNNSEINILRGQLQAVAAENQDLHAKYDDCHCHDEDGPAIIGNENTGWPGPVNQGERPTTNGDHL
jgi:hypothetical protein